MPLTTRHRDGRRLDSTNDEHWSEVHQSGYEGLFCPECDYAMHARAGSSRRIRHFAHNSGRPDSCSLTQGESPEHLHTKALIAEAVRALTGWTAEIERPGEGWRADVLATSPSGQRRIAFEPQFSHIHPDTAKTRTSRHEGSGVETVWLPTPNRVEHVDGLPMARLHYDDKRGVRVTAHAPNAEVERRAAQPPWWTPRRIGLALFVREVCLGAIAYGDGVWASDAQRADMARREQSARDERKAREVRQQAAAELALIARRERDAEMRAEQEAEKRRRAEEDRQRIEQWERDRPRREAEAARRRAEDEVRALREGAEREERKARTEEREREVERRRIEADPWHVSPRTSDEDLLALAYAFLAADKPFPEWIPIGDRLHAAIARRGLLHD